MPWRTLRDVDQDESRPTGWRGRPGRPVSLRSGDRYVGLGLELNVDYVAAVVLDLAGEVRPRDPARATAPLARSRAARAGAGSRGAGAGAAKLVGATVAVPGLVRADNRTVAWAPNVDVTGEPLASRVEGARRPVPGPGQQRRQLRGVRRDPPRRRDRQRATCST